MISRLFIVCTFLSIAAFQFSNSITVMSIDFGSEWIKVAIVKPGVPMEIVLNRESKRKTEAVVSFKNGEREFGYPALNKAVRFPSSAYFYLQDLLAKNLSHPLVQQYKERFPYYNLEENPETGYVMFRHDEATVYTVEELLAMLFNNSQSIAETYAEQKVDTCVLTVPTYFNQAERRSVLYAAELAGLKVTQLMDDSAAVALNYGVFRRKDMNTTAQYIMLYDMGATSTVATVISYQIVKNSEGTDPQLSVEGVGYDRTLGGLAIEFRLRDKLIERFNENKKTSMDVRESPRAMAKLLKEAKRVKQVLSANTEHYAQIEGLIDEEDFRTLITREELEEMCSDLWERVPIPMQQALSSAEIAWEMISKVILVGGGTRVPIVQKTILKESGKPDLGKSLNADEAAALGASYQAAAHSGGFRVKTFNVRTAAVFPIDVDFDREIELDDGSKGIKHVRKTLFQRNNPYPQKKVITFSRFYDNFGFSMNYGDLSFLDETQAKMFGLRNISTVDLDGVGEAYTEHGNKNGSEYKGVKVHFKMDESGILNLDESEAVFEVNKTMEEVVNLNETEQDPSTLQKIKDGISSLFGGGDDEGSKEPAKDEGEANGNKETNEDENNKNEAEGEEMKNQPRKEDKPKSENEETKTLEDEVKANTTEKAEPEKPKTKKTVKKIKQTVFLTPTSKSLDFVASSSDSTEASKDKLLKLAEQDQFKIDREKAMNSLEAYIYDKQDKIYQEEYEKALKEDEREAISAALTEATDWMFDLEGEPGAKVYSDKLAEIRKLTRPWLLRVKERNELPEILNDMESMLNYTAHLLHAITSLKEDEQIYTPVEIKVLAELFNDTMTWKNETLKKHLAADPTEDNILKPDMLKTKIGELNREVQYLLNKAKTTKPKKPKTESKKKNGTNSANTTETIPPTSEKTEDVDIKGDYEEGHQNDQQEEKQEEPEDMAANEGGGNGETIEVSSSGVEGESTTTTTTTDDYKGNKHTGDEL